MSDKVEQVKAAIKGARVEGVGVVNHIPGDAQAELMARAAIAAMREPTEDMICASPGGCEDDVFRWKQMIDAALQENGQFRSEETE